MEINKELTDEMREKMRNYINHTCIYRVEPGQKPLIGKAPGTNYIWQFYPRRALFDSSILHYMGILFWYRFAEDFKNKPFQITGLETGATPMLPAIAMTAGLFDIRVNVFSTRAERKKYGLYNRFEGLIDRNLPVMIVDDLCNSKNTIHQCKHYLEAEGLKVYDYGFAIINKDVDKEHPNHDKYVGEDLKMESIFNLEDFDLTWEQYTKKHGNVSEVPFIIEKNKS